LNLARFTRLQRGRTAPYVGAFAALLIAALGFAAAGSAAPTGSADLKITKTASAASVTEGLSLAYTIEVENLGPETATGVTVTDPLPNRVKFASATTTAGTCSLKGQKLVCAIGTLETGAVAKVSSATITLNVTPQKAQTITNTATVAGDQGDSVAANNRASVSTNVLAKGTPLPPGPTCRGIPATIVGTPGNDNLLGTGARDVIAALAGNDTVVSLAGRDLVCAGSGNDYVGAGPAADHVIGGAGKDRLLGRAGADLLQGNAGNDVLNGGRGPDRLRGGLGSDTCLGGPGLDSTRSCER
jgi:uncharacterized repeat protein (TIGR01451 family)